MNASPFRPLGMNTLNHLAYLFAAGLLIMGCGDTNGQTHSQNTATDVANDQNDHGKNPYYSRTASEPLNVDPSEWEMILSPELYHVAFEQGTERPFTGRFEKDAHTGIYSCSVCGNALFDAHTKFDSGTGWPSFYAPLPNSLQNQMDMGLGMMRTEVVCRRCGAHLGHVFEDGPKPTGLRYCINAVSLDHLTAK